MGGLLLGAASVFAQSTAPASSPASPPAAPSGIQPPELIQSSAPEYPEAARAAGREARVALRLDIDREGAVTHAEVVEPQGHGFDEAALRAAQLLRFTPAQRDGRAIPVRILFHYDFQLERPPVVLSAAFRGEIRSPEGAPLAGAHVQLSQDGALLYSADSDPQGAFALQGLAAGTYQLAIT